MKHVFLQHTGSQQLLLIFAGWGTDEHLFDLPTSNSRDCLLCYDYRDLSFDTSILRPYTSIRLLAWSMGVWVADYLLGPLSLPWERTIAFNGTPFPIDDERGIPTTVFEGTLAGFSETTLNKFRRRMCGTNHNLQQFLARVPQRGWTDLRDELSTLLQAVQRAQTPPSLPWHKAIIGQHDRIFPPANQQAAWTSGTSICHVDAAHYDAILLAQLIQTEDPWIKD